MIESLLALIVDEGKWLTFSMTVALVAAGALCYRSDAESMPITVRILAAMNLMGGLIVGTMALGHLLAVSVKLAQGTLRDGSLLVFVAIGTSLLMPSVLVVRHTTEILASERGRPRRTVALNGWLAGTLLVMGLHNLPLAALSLLTIAYRLHSGRLVGWAIVGIAAVVTTSLFAASLVFLASGQSFEQFRGIE